MRFHRTKCIDRARDRPPGSRARLSAGRPTSLDELKSRHDLKATVKATPVDAYGRDSTIQHVGLAGKIQNDIEWTPVDALNDSFVELQNRWSASLAMSTDGSFPSRPRQFFNSSQANCSITMHVGRGQALAPRWRGRPTRPVSVAFPPPRRVPASPANVAIDSRSFS
jgi:hypothetical protein